VEKLVNQPMQYVIDGGRGATYFIVDGLDESLLNGRSEIADALRMLISAMPEWFKLIVTMRPSKELEVIFKGCRAYELNLDTNEKSISDMDYYLEQKSMRTDEIATVVKRNFLLAELLSAENASGLYAGGGLAGYYYQVFSRNFHDGYSLAERVAISLLINSSVPVTEDVVMNVFGKDKREFLTFVKKMRELITFGYERYRSFYTLRTLTLFHASLKDWLISEAATTYRIAHCDGVKMTLEFYNRVIEESSSDLTASFIKNYELFLSRHNRFDILTERRLQERYSLIKERIAIEDDYSNKQSDVVYLDADKIIALEELSHRISILSNPIRYHYALPMKFYPGGAMDDYCEYYIFPCCNHVQVGNHTPHTVTENGCRAHYGDIHSLPQAIALPPEDEFRFWENRLREECAHTDELYNEVYNSIKKDTLAYGNFEALSENDKSFILEMVEKNAKITFANIVERKIDDVLSHLKALKTSANISDDEYAGIMSLVDSTLAKCRPGADLLGFVFE
jgi:hypothetical protein